MVLISIIGWVFPTTLGAYRLYKKLRTDSHEEDFADFFMPVLMSYTIFLFAQEARRPEAGVVKITAEVEGSEKLAAGLSSS
jgi:hypothetical protein